MNDMFKQFVCIVAVFVLATLYFASCSSQLFVQKNSDGSSISTSTTQEVSADSTNVDVNVKPLN